MDHNSKKQDCTSKMTIKIVHLERFLVPIFYLVGINGIIDVNWHNQLSILIVIDFNGNIF